MCLTCSTSTENWMVDRQLRSVWTTTLAMLRWTNTSPGARSTIWLAGTRESEQPIHRNSGACCRESRSKKPGSSAWTRAAQARLRSMSAESVYGMSVPVACWKVDAHVAGLGEEAHGLQAALAAQARRAHAAERRAQVAHQPGVDPHHAHAQRGGEAVRPHGVGGPHRRREAVVYGVGEREGVAVVVERLQRGHRAEDLLAVGGAGRPEALDHRGRDEPAGAVERLAAAQDLAAFLARPGDGR